MAGGVWGVTTVQKNKCLKEENRADFLLPTSLSSSILVLAFLLVIHSGTFQGL